METLILFVLSVVMAHDVTVDLGSFTICSHTDNNLLLTVSTVIVLSLPDNPSLVPTAVELWDQVKAGLLWITRAGSCCFNLSIYLEGLGDDLRHADLQDRRRQTVVEAFQAFPAWEVLGLDIRREVNLFEGAPGFQAPFVYSVQHNRQHTALFTPEGVACGFLSTVSSKFQFSTRRAYTIGKPSIDSRIVTLNVPSHELQRITGRPNRPSEFHDLPPGLQEERLKHLTHNALNLLVGLKKRPPGLRLLKPLQSPALLDLAPAVWNSVSFQDLFARTQLVPSISSALANLTSTQSPVLRQKVEALVRGPSLDSPFDDVSGELHQRMLVLLLRATYVQRTKLRSSNATRQLRTVADELTQIDQSGELNGTQKPQPVESVNDMPLDHGIRPFAEVDNAGEASMSGYLQEYRPLSDGVFEVSDNDMVYYEHNQEQDFVPFETMSYYNDYTHHEGTQIESQRRDHFDAGCMDGDDPMEDDTVCGIREKGPLCHRNLNGLLDEALREDSEGLQSKSPNPDDMVDDEGLFIDGLSYLSDKEEEYPRHHIVLDEVHEVNLAADTSRYVARFHDIHDDEMYYIQEERPTHIRAFGDDSDGYDGTDLAPEHASFHGDSDDYPSHIEDQGQVEGGFYEDPDEDCTFMASEDHTQDELYDYDQVMHSVSGADVETCGNHDDRSIGHIYDYQTDGVYTPEYASQFGHVEDAAVEETATYARFEQYSHGWDRVPRKYLHPRFAHLTRSMGVEQDLIGTHPSSGDVSESGLHGRSSYWNRASGGH